MTRTIESLDCIVYTIEVDGDDILLIAKDHTLLLHGAGFDPENIERYIDENFDLARRIDETGNVIPLFDLMKAF